MGVLVPRDPLKYDLLFAETKDSSLYIPDDMSGILVDDDDVDGLGDMWT